MRKRGRVIVTAIVPSAGKGARFSADGRKPFAKLKGRPLLSYALGALQSSPLIDDIVLVVAGHFRKEASGLVKRYRITKVKHIIEGGSTRQDSVRIGLSLVRDDASLIMIHDGVRPFISEEVIKKSIAAAVKSGAAISAVPVKATIKVVRKKGLVLYTPERNGLWEAQTPQVFKRNLIEKAYRAACGKKRRSILSTDQLCAGAGFTDDAAIVEKIGAKVKIVRGDYNNIKVTTAEDIKIAGALLKKARQRGS